MHQRLSRVRAVILAAVFLVSLMQVAQHVNAVPAVYDATDVAFLRRAMRQGNDCSSYESIRDLCQRCAKVTRSAVAYPLCCQNRENPRMWCMKFLDFGLT